MESSKELSAIIRAAMRDRKLDKQGLAALLGISEVMADKLLCGDLVPSSSLEKRMIEKLGVAQHRARRVADRQEKKSKRRLVGQEKTKRAA